MTFLVVLQQEEYLMTIKLKQKPLNWGYVFLSFFKFFLLVRELLSIVLFV
jgi:hypothetical protein